MLYLLVHSHQIWACGHARHTDIQVAGNKSNKDTWCEVMWAEGSTLAHKLSAKSRGKVPCMETSAKLKTIVALAFAGTAPLTKVHPLMSFLYINMNVHLMDVRCISLPLEPLLLAKVRTGESIVIITAPVCGQSMQLH